MMTANITQQADLDHAVIERIRRQSILYDQARRLSFLITEHALRSPFSPRDVLIGQLHRLLQLLDLPNVIIGILPVSAPLAAVIHNSFCIYDESLVTVETTTAELSIYDAQDIKIYESLFQTLSEACFFGQAAKRAVSSLIQCGSLNPEASCSEYPLQRSQKVEGVENA
jgi:hypothetical protein